MKTLAAVSYEPGEPLVIEELEFAEPRSGELLVKMAAVGLCHSDYHVLKGDRPVGMRPMVLGHEGAGVIEAVGPEVTRFKPGDHVVLMFIPSCGRCRYCIAGMTHACVESVKIARGPQMDGTYRLRNKKGQEVGQFCLLGAFSEYAVVNQDSACLIDPAYPLDVACLVGCGVVGGFGAAVNRANVRPGSSVLVIGVGGVGMNVIQGARICGASTIIAADIFDRKLKWSRTFGATHTINVEKEDLVPGVMDITDNIGVDYAFEVISSPETIGLAFESTAKLGKIVVIGITPAQFETLPIPPLNLLLFQKTIMGSLYGTSNAQIEIPKILYLYKNGQLKLEELITGTYSLDQINQGYQDMIDGKNIRGVVQFDG